MPEGKKKQERYDSTWAAALTGIKNTFSKAEPVGELKTEDRLEGKTCLITGANSGLGKAAALRLAKLGARVILVCRRGHPEVGEEIRRKSGNQKIEMEYADLTDFSTLSALCDRLKERGEKIHVAIFNAGVVPGWARRTKDGFEEMFQVNFLSKVLWVHRLLRDGTIPSDDTIPSRIIFVASEAHRGAGPIDLEHLGSFEEFEMSQSVARYGYSKLLLTAFFVELSRRIEEGRLDGVGKEVSVFALCPGAVNTNIARDVPGWIKPLVRVLLTVFFKSPMKASDPILFLSASPQIEDRNGLYLHLMAEKEVDDYAADPETGEKLWDSAVQMLKPWL
jgi:NAD(P)-dependent dehydrogenase (short-subunit alcohol dehydrogenase family)